MALSDAGRDIALRARRLGVVATLGASESWDHRRRAMQRCSINGNLTWQPLARFASCTSQKDSMSIHSAIPMSVVRLEGASERLVESRESRRMAAWLEHCLATLFSA